MTLDGFKVNTYLILGKILGTVIREEDIKILKKEISDLILEFMAKYGYET